MFDSLWLILGGVGLLVVILAVILVLSRWKVARVDQALIITGGKKPKVKVAGGGFVWPIIRKYSLFDLCMLTIEGNKDEIKTKTGVPIIVNWTAQIRPNSEDVKSVLVAATSFLERDVEDIKNDIKKTIDGGVREVVAGMTPEDVLRDKATFSERVINSVANEMSNMGYILPSLNIQDVVDNHGYYDNLAARDAEAKRQEAANITAEADQSIREQKAKSEQAAKQAELNSTLAVAEKQRDNDVKQAAFKAEVGKANADAEIAGALQKTIRQKELTTEEGQVEVVRQEQANLAAQREKEVITTRAEADKARVEIEAQAKAAQETVDATAKAKVAETAATAKANATKLEADGEAKATIAKADADKAATIARAEGEASATRATAEAEAAKIQLEGEAKANATRLQGEAEAEATKARMLAEAEGERALADARAANDGVNLKVTLAEIEARVKIEVATATAKVMADVGTKAKFVNFGGNGSQNSGNVLLDTLSQIPQMLEKLNITNEAITGKGIDQTVRETVTALLGPLFGIAAKGTDNTVEEQETDNVDEEKVTDQVEVPTAAVKNPNPPKLPTTPTSSKDE